MQGGLLGADYTIENGRYRIARIYNGENWNPDLQAPLTQPGVNVKAGEYLLAVNGRELRASDDIYSFFESTAGKQVRAESRSDADGTGAREVTVVPVDSEEHLGTWPGSKATAARWTRPTGGKVAYVYLPDTAGAGYTSFNRYFFAQVGKEAAIIDERFNGGGQLADYIIDYLRRPLLSTVVTREGRRLVEPIGGDLRAEGDDHQRDVPAPAATPCLVLPQDRHRAADRHAHVGRAGRHRRLPGAARRRRRHRAARRDLRPRRASGRSRTMASRRTSRSISTRRRIARAATLSSRRLSKSCSS